MGSSILEGNGGREGSGSSGVESREGEAEQAGSGRLRYVENALMFRLIASLGSSSLFERAFFCKGSLRDLRQASNLTKGDPKVNIYTKE